MPSNAPIVTKDVVKILGWPTDVVSIDFAKARPPHTYLLFVPGNPGLVGWYIPALVSILQQLGSGFAIRGVSYAGHGITEETVHVEKYEQQQEGSSKRNVQIPWTVNGQIDHKIAWIASIMEQQQQQQQHNTRLIFLSHSIGAHMVQRILVLRKDWRDRTTAILHWMPFIRMDAPSGSQFVLDTAAHYPDVVIGIGQRLLQATSRERMESLMKDMVPDKEGCELAVNLVQHPTFVRNFFELGTEEIRDLPQLPDVSIYTNEKRHERGISHTNSHILLYRFQRFDYYRRVVYRPLFCIAATINGFQNSTPMII
jgi:hypothetical protein